MASVAIAVPASIDATGRSDVQAELQAFIDGVPDGSTIVFPLGSRYRLKAAGLRIDGRHNLTFAGYDALIILRPEAIEEIGTNAAAFRISARDDDPSSGIRFLGLTIDGGNPQDGTTDTYDPEFEDASAFLILRGSHDIEIADVTTRKIRGHCVILSDESVAWPERVHIHDSKFLGCATMGFAIVAGRDIAVERNYVTDVGWSVIDIEPEHDWQGATDILIRDNDFLRYGWHTESSNWWLAAVPDDGGLGAVMDRIIVTGNRVHQGPAPDINGNNRGIGGLAIRMNNSNPKSAIAIVDNWTSDDDIRDATSATMLFDNVDGLAVTGNTQPMALQRPLVEVSDSENVNTSDPMNLTATD